MGYIICYLVVGDVLTMLLYHPEPEDALRDMIADAVLSMLVWPYLLAMTAIDMLRGDD